MSTAQRAGRLLLPLLALAPLLLAPAATAMEEMTWSFFSASAACTKPAGKPCGSRAGARLRMVAIRDGLPQTRWYTPVHSLKGQVSLTNVANVTAVHLRAGNASAPAAGRIACTLWPARGATLAAQPLSVAGTLTLTFDVPSTRLNAAAAGGDFDAFLDKLKTGGAYLSVSTAAQPLGELRGPTGVDAVTMYYDGLPDYLWLLGYLP